MFERMKAIFKEAGYVQVVENDMDPKDLGHMEYMEVVTRSGNIVLALGPGRTGDSGCSLNLVFDTLSGKLMCHGLIYEGESDDE